MIIVVKSFKHNYYILYNIRMSNITLSMDRFDTLVQELAQHSNMNSQKINILNEKMQELVEFKRNLMDLDTDLNEFFYDSKNNNQIIPDSEFSTKMGEINSDSLIIHIKKAQIYKVYDAKNLEEFQNDDNTIYRSQRTGPVHEVVRDNYPQKLIILVNDDVDEAQLLDIKNNIITFIKKNKHFAEITTSDVKAFSVDGNTEFVLSHVKLTNIYEKEKIIEQFIIFLNRCGKQELSKKIQFRPTTSLVEGVKLYKLPNAKKSLDNTPYNTVDMLLTTPVSNSIIINNTYIINNTVNTVNNGNINNVVNITSNDKNDTKSLKTFKKFIKDTKPEWYKENTYVEMNIIEKAYREYFEDELTTSSIISRNLNKVLFVKASRANNVNKKLLLKYSEL